MEKLEYFKKATTKTLKKKFAKMCNYENLLKATDYQAIKYAEGAISEAEYAPIKAQRQAWRDEINKLQEELSK